MYSCISETSVSRPSIQAQFAEAVTSQARTYRSIITGKVGSAQHTPYHGRAASSEYRSTHTGKEGNTDSGQVMWDTTLDDDLTQRGSWRCDGITSEQVSKKQKRAMRFQCDLWYLIVLDNLATQHSTLM